MVERKIGDCGKNEMIETFWTDEAEVEWKGESWRSQETGIRKISRISDKGSVGQTDFEPGTETL